MMWCAFLTFFLLFFDSLSTLPQQHKSRRPAPIFKSRITGGLILPDNATSIRENIVGTFSCLGKIYGFYADMENECQIFHVCFPQERNTIRWSFICPAETVFNQATFVCTRTESSIPCIESEMYYFLNEEIGKNEEKNQGGLTNPPNTEIDPFNTWQENSKSLIQEEMSAQDHKNITFENNNDENA